VSHWIILKQSTNNTHFLNLDLAYQIVHETHDNPAHDTYVIHFPNDRVTVRHETNPATYGHISAYLGMLEEE
jgi:hypothetical protein